MERKKFRRGPSRFAPPGFEDNSTFDMDSSQIHMLSNQATTMQGGYTLNQTQNYVLNQTKIYMVNPNQMNNQDSSYDSVLLSSNENQSFSMSNETSYAKKGSFGGNYANKGSFGGNYANHSNYTHNQKNTPITNQGQNRRGYVSKQNSNISNQQNNKSNVEGKENFLSDFLLIIFE